MNIQSQKKVIDRSSGIGGSDANLLVAGKWKELYEIKKGLVEEDLSFVLPVQLVIPNHSTENGLQHKLIFQYRNVNIH